MLSFGDDTRVLVMVVSCRVEGDIVQRAVALLTVAAVMGVLLCHNHLAFVNKLAQAVVIQDFDLHCVILWL